MAKVCAYSSRRLTFRKIIRRVYSPYRLLHTPMTKKALIVFTVLVAICGFFLFRWVKNMEKKVFIPQEKAQAIQRTKTVGEKFRDGNAFTIALVGYGGGSHEGTYLTDTIMAVHIDPPAKKLSLFSIPRDLYITIPTDEAGGRYHKINAAYTIGLDDTVYPDKPKEFSGQQGGGQLVKHTVSKTIGVPVDAFIGIDFAGFTKTIDTLGGVNVRVETPLDDPQYPISGKEQDLCGHTEEEIAGYTATASALLQDSAHEFFPCRYEHITIDAGIRHMDGETALKFVRSRHSTIDGSDFGRAKRQKSVLLAIRDTVISVGFIPKILPVLNDLGDSVRTDLKPEDVKTFVLQANGLSGYTMEMYALTDENYLMYDRSQDGQSILIPKAGQDNYIEIHSWISEIISGKPLTVTPTPTP